MKEIIEVGKTIEEAIKSGREKLGDPAAEFEILETPKKSLFGLKSTPAKVRVFISETEEAEALVPESKEEEAVAYLTSVLKAMGAEDFSIDPVMKEEGLTLVLECEDLGFIIGRRGETLDALQYLTGLAVNRSEGNYVRITLDSGNFREKREKTLESLARRLSKNVLRTGRSITLEPMNPYERRTIHATVAGIDGVESVSIGEEPNRRVVINSTSPRKPRYNKNNSRSQRNYNGEQQEKGERHNRNGEDSYSPRKQGGKDFKGGRSNQRRERSTPYEPKTVRETPPSEAKDIEAPLYGKIEL